MAKCGFIVHNYIDDICAVCHKDQADLAYETLKEILHRIGLLLNHKKVFAPCKNLNIMGITIDIESCTFSIAPKELHEIMQECLQMFLWDRFTKRELQSLLSKLLYIARCVSASRRLLNRMLHTSRESCF